MSRESEKKEAARFWEEMARETGEEIEEKALIRVISSQPLDLKDKWLLFFTTRSGLFYKRFPADSAMARLFNRDKREKDYPLAYMPWDRLVCRAEKASSFLDRLFGAADVIKLDWDGVQSFVLEMEKGHFALFEDHLETE